MRKQEALKSPRLAALEAAIAGGQTDALDGFWRDIEVMGAPLVEPVEGTEESLATFVWRDDGATESVAIIGSLGVSTREESALDRLPDTDVWYKTVQLSDGCRLSYSLSPNDPLTPWEEIEDWKAEFARWVPDPLNPRRWVTPADPEMPEAKDDVVSVLELPSAAPQPWSEPREGVAAGQVERYRLRSDILEVERTVFVYTPPGYDPSGDPYPLLVAFDGRTYIAVVPTPTILDNLAAEGRIPAMVAVTVESGDTRATHLPCHPPYAEFLATELIPWVRQRYHVSNDPVQTVVAGSSYGGLAAMFAALQHPEIFGKVLSQSGSFWWAPEGDPEPEWLTRQIAQSPRLPLRLYLDVGRLEVERGRGDGPSQLMANRYMRDVLTAREYPLRYVEYMGGHDYLWWRGTLADGLLWLMGKD